MDGLRGRKHRAGSRACIGFLAILFLLGVSGCPDTALLTSVKKDVWPTVAAPKLSPSPDTYSTGQNITITDDTEGATIHYTTDGSPPSSSSPTYSAPFTLSGNGTETVIQAFATKLRMNDSAITTGKYKLSQVTANSDLAGLTISSGSLSPAFSPSVTSYTTSVAYGVSTVTVTPTVAQAGATIQVRVNGGSWQDVLSGFASAPLALTVGPDVVDVKVTAQDGTTTKPYSITATRAAASADLSALTISEGSLSPAFSPSVTSYTTSVAYGVSTVSVTPTVAQVGATIQVRVSGGSWQDVLSGFASAPLALTVGPDVVDVKVTAQDGTTTKPYGLTATRAAASADLSALTISEGSLSPAFSPSVANYSTSLPYIVSTITVTATVAEAGATIQVRCNGGSWQATDSGFASGPLSMNVGSNPVEVVVTAADGVTIKGYAISVVRREGGALDTSFINSTVTTANAIVFQPNGKIVVGGSVSSRPGAARLNSDGSLETHVLSSTTLNGSVTSVAPQSDGGIVVGGSFSYIVGTGPYYNGYNIIRAKADGSWDSSFLGNGGGPNGSVNGIAIQDNQIVIVGNFDTYRFGTTPTTVSFMARLNSDSTLDGLFWPTANGIGPDWTVNTVVLNGGSIYIGGAYSSYAGWRGGVTRLYPNGAYDIPGPGFMVDDTLGSNGVRSLAVQPDGKTIIGGDFTTYLYISRHSIIRINSDGTLDSPFGIPGDGANGSIYAIALQLDGKILIGGDFTMYNGTSRNHIARLNTDGSIDLSFLTTGSGTDGTVYALAVQTDGMILIGGSFTHYNDTACSGIIRVRPD
jgi:uncharacterized delta-60 repeat protein